MLPIVIASALQANRLGPVALAAGMSLSFVALGLLVAVAGRSLGLTETVIQTGGSLLMIGFGLVLLVPRLNEGFALATSGMASRADRGIDQLDRNALGGQFLGGMLLGVVWSPCVGPTLGGAISLAAQGESIGRAAATMIAFAAGVSSIILVLGYGARKVLMRNRATMQRIAELAKPVMGIVFVAVGLALYFGLHHRAQAALLNVLPVWFQDLSISI